MDKQIRVVIADSDAAFGELLAEHINGEEDMQVCALARDGAAALEQVKSLRPDVLITDLMLREMDGLGLMRSLRAGKMLPRTIVVSGFLNNNLVEKAGEQGAEYFFLKPCSLQRLSESIRDCMRQNRPGQEDQIDKKLSGLLSWFGIAPHLCGYGYLKDAAVMIGMDIMPLQGVTKILYPELAKIYSVEARDVERCMRHAIKYGWEGRESGEADNNFTRSFSHKSKPPTNREMLSYLADRVREMLEEDNRALLL